MPFLIVKLAEMVVPPLIQLIVNHYSKKEQTPVVQTKVVAHQAALNILKASK